MKLQTFNKILGLAKKIEQRGFTLLTPLDLTPASFNVLNLLAQNPDGLSQSALSNELVVSAGATSQLVDRLERLKLVQRRDNPENRRAWVITLTPAGDSLWHKANQRLEREAEAVFERIPAKDLETLKKGIAKLEMALTN